MTGAGKIGLDRPIFIVSTPRSGSTLLFEALAQAPGLFTTGRESHQLIEGIPGLHPSERGWESNRLTAKNATSERAEVLTHAFWERLRDRDGREPPGRVRMLEKTPKNALRVPFLDACFPDAVFTYLYRDPRETLGSMIEAWISGAFQTYPELPGWEGPPWSLLLVPGWRALNGKPLPSIVARQWAVTTELLIADLEQLPRERLRTASYADLVAAPQRVVNGIAESLGLPWDRVLGSSLPPSKTTVSRPGPGKWLRFRSEIDAVLPEIADADAKARAFLEDFAGD